MYKIMLYGGMVGVAVMLFITIFIFIKGNVLEVIKDLLGIKNTRKTLNKNRVQNNTSGIIKPTITNVYSKPMDINIDQVISKGFEYTGESKNINVLGGDEETETLDGEEETELLNGEEDETELLGGDDDETIILGFAEETEVLNNFAEEVNIMIVNSDVII